MEPDASLGIAAGFDADQFRRAIVFAMQMGTPPDELKRARFIKKNNARTYWKDGVEVLNPRLDRDGMPLDPTVEVRQADDEEFTEDVAIEIERAEADELPVGNFRPTKAVVTVLDQQYETIRDCEELIFNEDRYVRGYEPEGLGLFSVGVNTLIYYAVKES